MNVLNNRLECFLERPAGLGEGWSLVEKTCGTMSLRDVLAGSHAISR